MDAVHPDTSLDTSNAVGAPPNELLSRYLEAVTDGFLAFDRDWRFTYLNEAGARTLGRPAAELVGTVLWNEFPELADTPFGRLYRRAVAERVTLEYEDYCPPFDARFAVRAYPSEAGLSLYFRDVTERRRAEGRLRAVVASIEDHFAMFDRDLRYVYVNDGAAGMLGRATDELIGHRIWDLSPEAVGNQFYLELHRALADGVPFRSEHYYAPWDRWFENAFYPFEDGISVLSTDVTERKRAQAERERLLASEHDARIGAEAANHRLQLGLTVARMVAWDWDPTTNQVQAGDTFAEIYGAPAIRVAEEGFALVHPDDAERHRDAIADAVAARGSYHSQFRVIRPDNGQVVWLEERATAVCDDEGNLLRLTGVAIDVTDRKEREDSLLAGEAYFREIADSVPAMVWLTDASAACTYLNRQWTEFTGQAPEDGLDMGWLRCVHPDDAGQAAETFLRANAQAEPFSLDFRLRRRDGEYRWAIDAGKPRFGAGGEFLGYVGAVVDVHDRKVAEQGREELLARERVARADAEGALRVRDEFLAMITHELRNPLASVKGFAQLMQRRRTYQERATEGIISQADHLDRLLGDLLDVTSLEGGRLELQFVEADLVPLIRACIDHARAQTETRAIRLLALERPVVGRIDRDRLGQVVRNLLSNAMKYSTSGEITVRILERGSDVGFSVEDRGVGIPPEALPKLFDRFYRVGSSLKGAQGMGIGLFVVKSLVEAHEGHVEVESVVGRGTTFTIMVPRGRLDGPEGG